MARYIVQETSFINNSLCKEGDEVEYDGEAGPNLKPVRKGKGQQAAPADEGQQPDSPDAVATS